MDDFQFFSDSSEAPKRFNLRDVQCLDCFCIYRSPAYSGFGLEVLLAEAGYSYGGAPGRADDVVRWLDSRSLLRGGSCVLDVGCYDGRFLAKLPDDVRKIGVDLDEPAIHRARQLPQNHNAELICGDFETFRCSAQPDVVLMLHVLEHLSRPVRALQNLRKMSHPGTVLVVEVPVLELGATNDINGFFAPLHLTHFSMASLRNCVSAAGWKIQDSEQQQGYNGVRFVATPAQESPITEAQDDSAVELLHSYLQGWYQALGDVEKRICTVKDSGRCVIWGAGFHTELLYQLTSLFNARKSRSCALVDLDPIKQQKTWRGIAIHPPSMLRSIDWSPGDVLIPSSYHHHDAIKASAVDHGVPPDCILSLYDHFRCY